MSSSISTIIIVVQVISALAIIGLVLLQQGKGADMGAAFGAGASGSLFGATGSSSFLSRSTAVAAAIFFAATLGLAIMNQRQAPKSSDAGIMENIPAAAVIAPSKAKVADDKKVEKSVPTSSGQAKQIPK